MVCLWCGVDQDDEILESYITRTCGNEGALTFTR